MTKEERRLMDTLAACIREEIANEGPYVLKSDDGYEYKEIAPNQWIANDGPRDDTLKASMQEVLFFFVIGEEEVKEILEKGNIDFLQLAYDLAYDWTAPASW